MKLKLFAALALFCCLISQVRAQAPAVVSYPNGDSGWTKNGNVSGFACGGSCNYFVASWYDGSQTQWGPRTYGSVWEPQNDEALQVQSDGGSSFISLLFSVPTTRNYYIALAIQGAKSLAPRGGQNVYPVVTLNLNGSNIQMCNYAKQAGITPTTTLTVDNGGHGAITEYVQSCAVQIPAGNNTAGITIQGGQGFGGNLRVRHMIVYSTAGITGEVSCVLNNNWQNTSINAADIFLLGYGAYVWANGNSNCGTFHGDYINLRQATMNGSGCSGGTICAMEELD